MPCTEYEDLRRGTGKKTSQSSESRSAEITTPILSIQNCINRSNIITGLVETYEDTLGNSPGGQNEMLRLANAFTGGDMDTLANRMNECFVSISEDLPRLRATHPIFDIKEPLPAKFTINVSDTKLALDQGTLSGPKHFLVHINDL